MEFNYLTAWSAKVASRELVVFSTETNDISNNLAAKQKLGLPFMRDEKLWISQASGLAGPGGRLRCFTGPDLLHRTLTARDNEIVQIGNQLPSPLPEVGPVGDLIANEW